jgi:hypothetical protein
MDVLNQKEWLESTNYVVEFFSNFSKFFEILWKTDLNFLIFSTIFRQRLDMTACLPLQGCIVQITSLQAKTEKLSAKTEIFFVIFSEF